MRGNRPSSSSFKISAASRRSCFCCRESLARICAASRSTHRVPSRWPSPQTTDSFQSIPSRSAHARIADGKISSLLPRHAPASVLRSPPCGSPANKFVASWGDNHILYRASSASRGIFLREHSDPACLGLAGERPTGAGGPLFSPAPVTAHYSLFTIFCFQQLTHSCARSNFATPSRSVACALLHKNTPAVPHLQFSTADFPLSDLGEPTCRFPRASNVVRMGAPPG